MSVSQLNHIFNHHYVRLFGVEKALEPSKKPKLVFLHGLLGNSQNWASVAKSFEKDFDVLTYDLRGHGRTGRLGEHYDPEVFSEDLFGLLEELKWSKVNAVGHSLGGRILMTAGSKRPELFDKLVIEDMGPHKTSETSEKTKKMINFVPTPFASRLEARAFFEDEFQPRYGKVLSDYLYGNLKRSKTGSMDWRFDKVGALKCLEIGHKRDFWDFYKDINFKHLIMRGELSEHLPREIMEKMVLLNSKAKSVEISGAGHWVHFDQRALFVEELTRFLNH